MQHVQLRMVVHDEKPTIVTLLHPEDTVVQFSEFFMVEQEYNDEYTDTVERHMMVPRYYVEEGFSTHDLWQIAKEMGTEIPA